MSVTVKLPDEALARLRAEAARRGVSIDTVITELAAQLPGETPARTHRLSFIGIGASGRTDSIDIHDERAELAARKHAEGI